MIPREEGQGKAKAEKSMKWKLEGPGLIYFFFFFFYLPPASDISGIWIYLPKTSNTTSNNYARENTPIISHRIHPPQYHHWGKTHVKAKKSVVAPTKKMAAAETGTYLLGLNFFPDSAGMLEL